MRIGIDARFYGKQSGIGRYITMLVDHLIREPNGNEYVIFVSKQAPRRTDSPGLRPDWAGSRAVRIVSAQFPWYGFSEQILLPFILYRYRLDLVHFPHWNVPFLYRRPYIVTIHDLILLHFPDSNASTRHPLYFKIKHLVYRAVLANAVATARTIIAVSNFTRIDIEERFPAARGRVKVVYEGSAFHPVPLEENVPLTDSLPANYLLYVGNAYPHKNIEFLIHQFAQWRTANPDFHLLLAGPKDYFYDRLAERVRTEGLHQIRFLGAVSDAQLATLYRHACAYVFPSLYEGFGLPPLEAMHAGVPVLASNATCLPEVLGDAALYFDPRDAHDLRRGLEEIVHHKHLRDRLRARGHERAGRYRWDRMGDETRELYRNPQT